MGQLDPILVYGGGKAPTGVKPARDTRPAMRGGSPEPISDGLWEAVLARDPRARHAAPLYGALLDAADARTAPSCSAASRRAWTAASPPTTATRSGSAARPTCCTPTACARCPTRWWSAPARCAPTTRCSPRATAAAPRRVRVVIDTERRLGAALPGVPGRPRHAAAVRRGRAGGDGPATPRCCACRAARPAASTPPPSSPRWRRAAFGASIVEGGGITVSRFLAAGCLDRLHVTIAPLLLGSGIPAFTLPGVARPQDGHAPGRGRCTGSARTSCSISRWSGAP